MSPGSASGSLSQNVLGNSTDVRKSGLNQNPEVLDCFATEDTGWSQPFRMLNQAGNTGTAPHPGEFSAPLGTEATAEWLLAPAPVPSTGK